MRDGTAQGSTLGPTLCSLFFLPILLLWKKKLLAKNPPTVETAQSDGSLCEVFLPIHNFADGTLIVAATREAAEEVAREFISCLEDFQMQAHKGAPTAPNSKTVVVHFYSSIVARDATDHTPILMKTDGSEFVNFETSVVCLGALLTEDLRDDADARSRVCKVTQTFGFLRRNLMASKKVETTNLCWHAYAHSS